MSDELRKRGTSRYFADLTQPEIAAQFKKNPL